MPSLVKLPDERIAQLREIAKAEDLPLADVIGLLIKRYLLSNGQQISVPDWTITKSHDGDVVVEVLAIELKKNWSPEITSSVSDLIKSYSDVGKSASGYLHMDAAILIERRGTSVKITNTENSKTVVLARSIALDVADLLRKAATELT